MNNNTYEEKRAFYDSLVKENVISNFLIAKITSKQPNDDEGGSISYFADVLDLNNELKEVTNKIDNNKLTVHFRTIENFKDNEYITAKHKLVKANKKKDKEIIEVISDSVRLVKDIDVVKNFLPIYLSNQEDVLSSLFFDFVDFYKQLQFENFTNSYFLKFQTENISKLKKDVNELTGKKSEILNEKNILDNELSSLKKEINENKILLSKIKNSFWSSEQTNIQDNNTENNGVIKYSLKDAVTILQKSLYGFNDEKLIYTENIISTFLKSLKMDTLTLLCGPSGTGKSSLVNQIGKIVENIVVHHIPVKSNWTDEQDLLGFHNPITNQYLPTVFLDALVSAKFTPEKIHIICLDEMNLAHIEYYFASFLSIREKPVNERYVDLYSKKYFNEAKSNLSTHNYENLLDANCLTNNYEILKNIEKYFDEINLNSDKYSKEDKREIMNCLELILLYPAKFLIPDNVRFVGTLNMDSTVKPLSPKVIDRSFIIEINHLSDEEYAKLKEELDGCCYETMFNLDLTSHKKSENDDIVLKVSKNIIETSNILNLIPNFRLNGRALKQINDFTSISFEDENIIYDQLVYSKILPRISVSVKDDLVSENLNEYKSRISKYEMSSRKFDKMMSNNFVRYFG